MCGRTHRKITPLPKMGENLSCGKCTSSGTSEGSMIGSPKSLIITVALSNSVATTQEVNAD